MNRIKELRKRLGINQTDLAQQLGIVQSTLSYWEQGKYDVDNDSLRKLADIFGVSTDYILGVTDNLPQKEYPPTFSLEGIKNILPIETYKIPLLGNIACGELKYANEDFEGYVECGNNIQADFALRAEGDSMINARILDGDIVFIRKQPTVEHGEIAAVVVDDETTLKRFYQYGDTMVLKAENPAYKDIEIKIGEERSIYILGKAIAFQSDVI